MAPPSGLADAASPDAKKVDSSGLEDYVTALETKLALKSALLDEAVRLHQKLETRLFALEEGLAWKDAQLEALSRQSSEAWSRANQELSAACRDREAWRERAGRLEEENCFLRDALLERDGQGEGLRRLIAELQQQLAQAALQVEQAQRSPRIFEQEDTQGVIQQLTLQLKESHQKNVLLEEKLQLRTGSDPRTRAIDEVEAPLELGLLPYTKAWAAVGLGAADRICGASPHVRSASTRGASWGSATTGGSLNVATGGCLPDISEESLNSDDDYMREAVVEPECDTDSMLAVEEDREETEAVSSTDLAGSAVGSPTGSGEYTAASASGAGGTGIGAGSGEVVQEDDVIRRVERRTSWCEQLRFGDDVAAEAPPATHFASATPGAYRQRSSAWGGGGGMAEVLVSRSVTAGAAPLSTGWLRSTASSIAEIQVAIPPQCSSRFVSDGETYYGGGTTSPGQPSVASASSPLLQHRQLPAQSSGAHTLVPLSPSPQHRITTTVYRGSVSGPLLLASATIAQSQAQPQPQPLTPAASSPRRLDM
mmetsp:Transcript_37089/g.106556  ORF Transcript_37089/g.106556 Transcript_37089/m.106556 type:complete len:539 (-) Transcript_37089:52-1668(-)